MKRVLMALVLTLLPAVGSATVVEQAPWAPEAAAYRLTLFLGNLNPVQWSKIVESWESPVDGASADVSAMSQLSGGQKATMRAALESSNRQSVFEAATKALATAILADIASAAQNLGTAQAALDIGQAQALYRAFQDGIRAADPDGYRRLGRAWLEMNSALGNKGVLGTGVLAPDADRFAAGRDLIETYIRANYAPAD